MKLGWQMLLGKGNGVELEVVMNELRRVKHSTDFLANSSHIIESAAISAS